MSIEDDWERPRPQRGWGVGYAGMGALRLALLFGSAAVALALILTPLAVSQTERMLKAPYPSGLDTIATGSVGQRGGATYTLRRSVLQPSPNSICVIDRNGAKTGDC